MRKLFRNMDLLKALILLCLVGSLGLGGWNLMLTGQLQEAKTSYTRAQTDVAEIFSLLKQIQPLYQAKDDQGAAGEGDTLVYFQTQLTEFGGIPLNRYTLKPSRNDVTIDRKPATDFTLRVDFQSRGRGEERLYLPRMNLFRALYNCERKSKRWKLRELKIRAKEDVERTGPRDQGYPDELADEWYVDKLEFAAREPRTN